MKIPIDGQMYEWDNTALTMLEAYELKEKTGLGLRQFQIAAVQGDPDAYRWIAYLAKKRAGETPDWDTFDFDLAAMIEVLEADDEPEETDASDPSAAVSDGSPPEKTSDSSGTSTSLP